MIGRAAIGVAVAAGLLVAGCGPNASNQDVGLGTGAVIGGVVGSQFGGGRGRIATTVVGAVIGGIIGSEIGRKLDERDRLIAQQMELEALEAGDSGVPRRWRSRHSEVYGEFVPGRPIRRGERDCRPYTHTIYIGGRPEVMRGVACRNPDGSWSNVG